MVRKYFIEYPSTQSAIQFLDSSDEVHYEDLS